MQGLALLEGRLVEALLGVRMPRRPLFAQPGLKWLERLKGLLTDKHTWLSMLYMVLQLPLGTLYFVMNVTLIAVALSMIVAPFVQVIGQISIINNNGQFIFLPVWAMVLTEAGGLILLTLTMHLSRAIGGLHGRYAKWMLVS